MDRDINTLSRGLGPILALVAGLVLLAGPAAAQTGTLFVEGDDVGIGTATPTSRLHVRGNDGATQVKVEETSGVSAARDLLVLRNPGATRFLFQNATTAQTWEFKLNAGDDFAINDPGHSGGEFILTKTGDLFLSGDVFTSTCSGTPCAPDYVFEPGYELMPLEELDRFVRENRHLPNIPPAAEMADKVNLGQMQMKLLEKVEELTLHVIALDRENRELREEVRRLAESGDAR